jgi:hypothetical protein
MKDRREEGKGIGEERARTRRERRGGPKRRRRLHDKRIQ